MVKLLENTSFLGTFMAKFTTSSILDFSLLAKIKKQKHEILRFFPAKWVRKTNTIIKKNAQRTSFHLYYFAKVAARFSEASIFSQRFS